MGFSKDMGRYVYKSILALCVTFVICFVIYAFSNRYNSYPSGGGGEYISRAYVVDSWTGNAWLMENNDFIPVKNRI